MHFFTFPSYTVHVFNVFQELLVDSFCIYFNAISHHLCLPLPFHLILLRRRLPPSASANIHGIKSDCPLPLSYRTSTTYRIDWVFKKVCTLWAYPKYGEQCSRLDGEKNHSIIGCRKSYGGMTLLHVTLIGFVLLRFLSIRCNAVTADSMQPTKMVRSGSFLPFQNLISLPFWLVLILFFVNNCIVKTRCVLRNGQTRRRQANNMVWLVYGQIPREEEYSLKT